MGRNILLILLGMKYYCNDSLPSSLTYLSLRKMCSEILSFLKTAKVPDRALLK